MNKLKIINTSLNTNMMNSRIAIDSWVALTRISIVLACLLYFTLLTGCDQTPKTSMTSTGVVPARTFSEAALAQGAALFQEHCAKCHGKQAQGNAQWRKPDASGFYPPPPLDGSGHAWHHSRVILAKTIKHGSVDGQGNMPAMGAVVNDKEIEVILDWLQSQWPKAVYAAWYEMQADAGR